MKSLSLLLVCAFLMFGIQPDVWAAKEPPANTPDGLQLIESKNVDLLYTRPGAELTAYRRIYLLPATVSFVHDYQRKQNALHYDGHRVTDEDMANTKTFLADLLREEFTDVLQNQAGYVIVEGVAADVLAVRPAIMDLDVVAPETRPNTRSAIPSAGSMTLYLELIDSVSGQSLAKALDQQIDRTRVKVNVRNSDRNEAAARSMVREWAELLRHALDEAHRPDTTATSPEPAE